MKELIRLTFFNADDDPATRPGSHLPAPVFQECISRWPEFRRPNSFSLELEKGSPQLTGLLDFLRLHGKEMNWKRYPSFYQDYSRFQPEGRRIFDEADINTSTLLTCSAKANITMASKHQQDGLLVIPRRKIKSQVIGNVITSLSAVVCTETLRRQLETEDFEGIAFRPVVIQGEMPAKEPLWQLWSDLTLPPVLNDLVDETGKPFDPDRSSGCVVDDLFFPWLLRYKQTEIEHLSHFDVAITAERWGWNAPHARDPYLIVSQRFRTWCDGHKLKLAWTPILLV